jgi:hypothetical protein
MARAATGVEVGPYVPVDHRLRRLLFSILYGDARMLPWGDGDALDRLNESLCKRIGEFAGDSMFGAVGCSSGHGSQSDAYETASDVETSS